MMTDTLKQCAGYQSLQAAIEKDCLKDRGIFHAEGCVHCPDAGYINGKTLGKCFHAYCDKFAWVIKRVLHYAEKTGIPAEDILNAWEAQRDYWYMNYYQECNQPEIKGDNVRVYENIERFKISVDGKGYRCPRCGGISTNPQKCDTGNCDWKAYGLFGTMGKGVTIFLKDKLCVVEIFKPVAFEDEEKGANHA